MTPRSNRLLARRSVLGGLLGGLFGAAASAVPFRRAIALSEGPPPFESGRHQFTILRPARAVPPVEVARLDGKTTNLASFRGKVVLVNLWATWCPACRAELPILERLQDTMGRSALQVLAISLDRGGRAIVTPFLRDLKIRRLDIGLDPESRLVHKPDDDDPAIPFDAYGMPISYVIDPAGRIAGYVTGEADWMSEDARNLLAYYAGRGTGN